MFGNRFYCAPCPISLNPSLSFQFALIKTYQSINKNHGNIATSSEIRNQIKNFRFVVGVELSDIVNCNFPTLTATSAHGLVQHGVFDWL